MLRFEITQNGQTREVKLEGDEHIIGRRNERTAVGLDLSPDDLVSRTHARIWREGGEVRIEDLGSRSGTFVNGEKLSHSQVLRPGEVVTMGETQLSLKGALPDRKKRGAPKGTRNPGRKRPGKPRPRPASPASPGPLPGNSKVGLHVEWIFDGNTTLDVFDRDEIFIGRKHPEADISLDLSTDLLVSRTHARIWQTRGICWVEDLGSTHGTLLNGEALDGAAVVNTNDKVQIGSTLMRIWHVAATDVTHNEGPAAKAEPPSTQRVEVASTEGFPEMDSYPVFKEEDYRYHPVGQRSATEVDAVLKSRKSPVGRIRTTHACGGEDVGNADHSALLEVLPGLAGALDAHEDVEAMAGWLVKQLPEWLPGVKRAALFGIDPELGRIRVQAHVPVLTPVMSDTLAHRVLDRHTGYAWQQVSKKESVRRLSTHAGMYVPLVCAGCELGVLCAEDTEPESEFTAADLAALMAVGQVVALAWASRDE